MKLCFMLFYVTGCFLLEYVILFVCKDMNFEVSLDQRRQDVSCS